MKKVFPIFGSLTNYDPGHFKGDLWAGLTVGVMLIPQGMAYAMIAGLPPIYGLYASSIPLIIYALLGTSRQLAVGPVAMVSLLTAAGISSFAAPGSAEFIGYAITLALLVGIIQFTLGIFKLGFLVNFLSHPVISGFTSAAALIIGFSQLKHLFGLSLSRELAVYEIPIAIGRQFGEINWTTFALGAIGIALILVIRKINKKIPGLLLAVILSIVATYILKLNDQGVLIVGSVPQGLPQIWMPQIDFQTIGILAPTALAISLVSFMESIAVAKSIQAKHKDYKVIPNKELIALGLSNVGGAFFQSYPVTGGFSRTAVNDDAGAKTGMASIISALLIILTLLFLTPLFYYLPNAILASVILVAVYGLIDVKEAMHLWKADRSDFWMLIITFISTLILGIEIGIGIGVFLSLAIIIYRTTRPHIAVLGKVPDTNLYRNVLRFEDIDERPDILIVRFDDQLYFANINFFQEKIEELIIERSQNVKTVIIASESISFVDSSAITGLKDLVKNIHSRNMKVYFSGVIGPVRDRLYRSKLMDLIGKENFFINVQEAVNAHEKPGPNIRDNELQQYSTQSNLK